MEDEITKKEIQISSYSQLQEFVLKLAKAGTKIIVGKKSCLPNMIHDKSIAFLDISGLSEVIEYSFQDQTICVQAGMSVNQLNKLVASKKQWWPIHTNNNQVSIVDVINKGEGGCIEHGYGGPRQLVLGLQAMLSYGKTINCGGKVVKNVSGFDLQKLFIGSHGWLGIVHQANLRLFALPETSCTLVGFSTRKNIFACAHKLIHSGLHLSCLELVDSNLLNLIAKLNNSKKEDSAILIQAHGSAESINQIIDQVKSVFSHLKIEAEIINEEIAQKVWSTLSDTSSTLQVKQIELIGTISQIIDLLNSYQNNIPFWQARPSKGCLKIYSKDEVQMAYCLELIKKWSQNEALTFAFEGSDFSYQVDHFPKENQYVLELKQKIKTLFDPSQTMNPFIKL